MPNTTAVPDLPALPELPKAAYPGTSANIPNAIPDLFRPDQMTAYGQACIAHYIATQPAPSGDVRNQALEEAAKIAESFCAVGDEPDEESINMVLRQRAQRIRALATSRAATVAKDGGEPAGWLYGNSYWERDNQRITDHIKKHGKPLYATPKPEASAANQQAVLNLCAEMVELHAKHGAVLTVHMSEMQRLLAAPISEGTGNPTAADAGGLSTNPGDALFNRKLAHLESQGYEVIGRILHKDGQYALFDQSTRWLSQPNYWRLMHEQDGTLFEDRPSAVMAVAAPAASNGDALPPLPEAHLKRGEGWTPHFTKKQMRSYAKECIAADRAARAGTGSAGSIGEDAEFNRLVMCIAAAAERKGGYPKERQDLVAYINTRATKVEAAPGNAGEVTDEQRIETIEKFITDAKARGFEWDSMSFDTNATARAQLDGRILATPKGPAA